jgi:hypothetical protein
LSRYLPEVGRDKPPAWLVQERSDDILDSFDLVYHEDSEIARRFIWLEQRFGLLKVDIVAAIVTRYLPASPFCRAPKTPTKKKTFLGRWVRCWMIAQRIADHFQYRRQDRVRIAGIGRASFEAPAQVQKIPRSVFASICLLWLFLGSLRELL